MGLEGKEMARTIRVNARVKWVPFPVDIALYRT